MAAFIKGKLKLARDAISSKAFEKARDAAREVLSFEPDNYNANVFLGLASLELGELEQSERAYRKAIDTTPQLPLAWQGLTKFYEKAKAWQKYAETLEQLARLSSQGDDAIKCAEYLQKLISLRKEHGTRPEVIQSLLLLLPGSEYYSVLSNIPAPDPTNPTASVSYDYVQAAIHNSLGAYEELVLLTETQEEETIKQELDKRRMRLGAPRAEELRKQVGREIWAESKLPELYSEILNHASTADDLRRSTESKLWRYQQRHLHALPNNAEHKAQKERLFIQVQEIVNGIVLLNIPDELAWTVHIDGKDAEFVRRYDWKLLRRYTQLFPESPLTTVIQAYFIYIGIPIAEVDDEETQLDWQATDDPIDVVLGTFPSVRHSILEHRVLVDIYYREKDHEETVKISEAGIALLQQSESANGRGLPLVRKSFNIALATSLVHLLPPKNHLRALDVLEMVLTQDPDNVPCLMGRGYIMQFAEKWREAQVLFERVDALLPNDRDEGLEAREEQAWCHAHLGEYKDSAEILRGVLYVLETLDDRDAQKARCWWRLGRCFWDMGDDESREEAYRHFITALKRSPSYAPAFTSLGIYYSEYQQPPDAIRASKCFQKAFEIDPREAEAARRLALGFAEECEWDLVEVIARRTIQGEGGLPEGAGSVAAARYLPTNAWAWKALGVVELHERRYPEAIEAFQITLRADPDDHSCWVRLGEAYSKAGRHAAAQRALTRAQELKPDDWVTSYLVGEVHRQTGQFDEAVAVFEAVLTTHPSEPGVLFALAQSHLSLGCDQLSDAFVARAEASFVSAVTTSIRMIELNSGFSRVVWKIAADAAFHLSKLVHFVDQEGVDAVLTELSSYIVTDAGDRLAGILTLPVTPPAGSTEGSFAIRVAVAAYSYRASLGSLNEEAAGAGWYDLSVAFHTLAEASLSDHRKEAPSAQALVCLKNAVRDDPGNATYWIALGHLSFVKKPKMAQHAYVRALELDSKNVVPWTYLGLLYLHHDDVQLANEALYRAQVLDPDSTMAWVGQGLVASANGHQDDAMTLFEHAVGLTANVPEADLEYATRAFARLSHSTTADANKDDLTESLLSPFFSLDRYTKRRPDDAGALHLFALVCERLGHFQTGVSLVERAIALLEGVYEETEDPDVESHFSMANTTLGRLQLAVGNHDGALQAFQNALGLLEGAEEGADASALGDERTVTLRTHCLFGSGLAHFKMGDIAEALAPFESALAAAAGLSVVRGQVTVLLAQALWEMGTAEAQESAKSQLLQCIAEDPENLAAITALAGMGILTNDDGLVDAALSELLALPRERRNELDPARDVNYLLIRHHLAQGDIDQALDIAQDALHAEPSSASHRRDLAVLLLQKGDTAAAAALLPADVGSTVGAESPSQTLRLGAIAHASDTGLATKQVQKAVMVAPWEEENWDTLAYVRTPSAVSQ